MKVPPAGFELHRVALNSFGDGVGSSRQGVYRDQVEAENTAERKACADNCRSWQKWIVVRRSDGATVASFGPYPDTPEPDGSRIGDNGQIIPTSR
jgi:hypothetical protein